MQTVRYDVAEFEEDPKHFRRVELLLAVKSFDLQAIRSRYLESRSRGRVGSVGRRKPALGALVHLVVEDGRVVFLDIVGRLTEPRGVDACEGKIAVASDDQIYVFNEMGNPQAFRSPWMSYVHTVRFNSTGERVIAASSGVDAVLEVSLSSGGISWEWFAWEHGFSIGQNPVTGEKHFLTRRRHEAEWMESRGWRVVLMNDAREDVLPTALRSAFVNSAEYTEEGSVLATLFHQGRVIEIAPDASEWRTVMNGMSMPHGGTRYASGVMATDTGNGRVICEADGKRTEFDFSRLEGKPEPLKDLEWIQFARFNGDALVAVDANRTSLSFVDATARKRMSVAHDERWAVQEFAFLDERAGKTVERTKRWFR